MLSKLKMCGVVCILCVLFLISILMFARKNIFEAFSTSSDGEMTSFDQFDSSSDSIFLVKFWAPWCGHCRNMESDWNNVYNKYHNTTVNNRNIKVYQIQDENPLAKQFSQKYNYTVKGFPTILKIRFVNQVPKIQSYEGSRTFEALSSFIEN